MREENKMEFIRKCVIEQLAPPVFGHNYNVSEWYSIDGGKTFWYCGHGKYCKTMEEATDYAKSKEGPA